MLSSKLERAIELFNQEKYKDAEKIFKELCDYGRSYALQSYYYLAKIYFYLREETNSLNYIDKFLNEGENNNELLFIKARIYENSKQYAKSYKILKSIKNINDATEKEGIEYFLIISLLEMNRYVEAEQHLVILSKIKKQVTDYGYFLFKCKIKFKKKKYDEVIKEFEESFILDAYNEDEKDINMQEDENNIIYSELLLILGECFIKVNKIDKLNELFYKHGKNRKIIDFLKAKLEYKKERFKEAYKLLFYLDIPWCPEFYLLKFQVNLKNNTFHEDDEEILKNSIRVFPNFKDSVIELARYYKLMKFRLTSAIELVISKVEEMDITEERPYNLEFILEAVKIICEDSPNECLLGHRSTIEQYLKFVREKIMENIISLQTSEYSDVQMKDIIFEYFSLSHYVDSPFEVFHNLIVYPKKMLGKGIISNCYYGQYVISKIYPIAVKYYDITKDNISNYTFEIFKQIFYLIQIKEKKLTNFPVYRTVYCFEYKEKKFLYLLTDCFRENISLFKCLQLKIPFNLTEKMQILYQILRGMVEYSRIAQSEYDLIINSKTVVISKDIKDNHYVILTGINKSAYIRPDPRYFPPEIFDPQTFKDKKKGSVYQFGILMWELLSERTPFENISDDREIISRIKNNEKPDISLLPEVVPQFITSLIFEILETEPTKRIDLETLLDNFEIFQRKIRAKDTFNASYLGIK